MDVPHELASVRGELSRADGKASTLLNTVGTAVTVAAAVATVGTHHLPLPALVVLWVAVGLLSGSFVALLLAIRPDLPRRGGAGWVTYACSTPAELAARPAVDYERDQAAELVVLSRLATAKYRAIRTAVHFLFGAMVAVLILAVVLVATGGGA